MEKQYKIADGRLIEAGEEPGQIKVFITPDASEKASLIENFKLDEHTLNSALDPDELSRLEFEPDHMAMILKRPKNYSSEDNLLYKITSIGIFLFKDKLIVIINEDMPILEGKQTTRLFSLHDVFLRVISAIIGHFLAHLRVINMLSESIEQKINTSMENKYLINMFTLEKSLVYYINGISSNVAVIEKIKYHSAKISISQENMEVLDDIIIENAQCLKQAEVYSNILTGLMDARGSIVNNNQNVLIRRLTLISIVFLPLNIIASIGGMSEFTMMTLGVPWHFSYGIFTAGLTVIGFLTYFFIRNMGFDKRLERKGRRLFGKRGPADE